MKPSWAKVGFGCASMQWKELRLGFGCLANDVIADTAHLVHDEYFFRLKARHSAGF